jgi:exodeoxyribonuclease-3
LAGWPGADRHLERQLRRRAAPAPARLAAEETKTNEAGFPTAEVNALGYEVMHVGDGRWNGVAVLSRVGLEPVSRALPGLPEPTEPRYAVADCGGLRTVSVYVPNGRSVDDPHYAYKLDWFAALRRTLDDADPAQPLVIMGDFNVARTDADVWDIASFQGSVRSTTIGAWSEGPVPLAAPT